MKEKGFWEGVQAAVPTALGYVSIGLACGIIGSPYVTPVEMGLMSLFVYAGSAQFAMIALIAVQAPVAAIAMTVFLINLRLFLLSLHASTYFRHTSLWHNIGMSSLLTDETYGVLMGELVHTDKVNPMWMHGNNLNSYVAWDFYFPVSDYAKTDSFAQSLHNFSSCSCIFLLALDGGVSVISCSVCDLARLYHGGGLGWSVSMFY